MGATYRKGLLLSLGSIIQTQVDLYTVVPSGSDKPGMNRLCPDHKVKVTQAHHCAENGGHYVVDTILGKDTGNGFLIPEGDKPRPESTDVLELTPVPVDELSDTLPGKSRFYLVPSQPSATETWQVLFNLLTKGKIALVTKGSLRSGSYPKLWRVETYRDSLVLTEISYPDVLNTPPEVDHIKVQRQITTLVEEFVSKLMVSWNKVDTTNVGREKMDEWLATAQTIENVQVKETNIDAAQLLIESLKAAVTESE